METMKEFTARRIENLKKQNEKTLQRTGDINAVRIQLNNKKIAELEKYNNEN